MAAQSGEAALERKPCGMVKNPKKRSKASKATEIELSSEDEGIAAYDICKELQANKDDGNRLLEMTNHYASEAVQESQSALSSGEENKLVRATMRFMLFRQMQKPGIPVKRDELSKLIPSSYKSQKIHQLGKLVIQQAQAKFPTLFGMEMKEMTAVTAQGTEGPKMYVLRSLLSHPLRSQIRSKDQENQQALLMVILPLILLAGGKLSEDDLEMHLKKIGLFTTKRYLAETRETGPEGVIKVYTVGPLAMDEIQENNVKTFMDAVFKNTVRSST